MPSWRQRRGLEVRSIPTRKLFGSNNLSEKADGDPGFESPSIVLPAACKPNSVTPPKLDGMMTISLGVRLLERSSDLPADDDVPGRNSPHIWSCGGRGLPCRPSRLDRGALLPHHFTLACDAFRRSSAVSFLLHFPSDYSALALPGVLPCAVRTFLIPNERDAIITAADDLIITETVGCWFVYGEKLTQ